MTVVLKNYVVESAIRDSNGLLQECPTCQSDTLGLWNCETCHKTGLAPPPLKTEDGPVVVTARPVYEGRKKGKKGELVISKDPVRYDLLGANPCCGVFQELFMDGLWEQYVMRRTGNFDWHRSVYLKIADRFGLKTERRIGVCAEAARIQLHYCPTCGESITVELKGRRVEVTRVERSESQEEYSEPDIVEV